MVCHLSQPDALLTCFMEDFYFCRATFASLIPRILLCLHMQTHSMLEIELYADQINILHLRNQSILSWIPRDRINPSLWSFEDIQSCAQHHFNVLLSGRNWILPVNLLQNKYLIILLAKCTSALIAPRYGVSSPRSYSFFFWDQTES